MKQRLPQDEPQWRIDDRQPHIIERSGLPADERYFIGYPLGQYSSTMPTGHHQFGHIDHAIKFGSKEAAEEIVAHIEKEDGYDVYASKAPAPARRLYRVKNNLDVFTVRPQA